MPESDFCLTLAVIRPPEESTDGRGDGAADNVEAAVLDLAKADLEGKQVLDLAQADEEGKQCWLWLKLV
eukprot:1136612-Pelagomonas_calceolata.AAC.6